MNQRESRQQRRQNDRRPLKPHVVLWTFALMLSLLLVSGGGVFVVQTVTSHSQRATCANAKHAPNPVAAENMCPGSAAWQWSGDVSGPTDIEGFVAPASVTNGDSLHLFVTTTASTYTFEVFRLGWYSGLGGRLMYTSPDEQGIRQPAPTIDPHTHMVSCDTWKVGPTLTIPENWVSGIYIVKFFSSDGHSRYTPLVVRDETNEAPIVYQASFLTYQAYNQWGGYSLYLGINPATKAADAAHRAYSVSFDRPYLRSEGLGDLPTSELNMIRWLERESYDMTYATDMDLDASPTLLHGRQLLIIGGHDEYWSTAMRDHASAARDAGVSLAFFSANNMYWHIRLRSTPLGANREEICYRVAELDPVYPLQPLETTVRWRDPPLSNPESNMLGQMYQGIEEEDTVAPLMLTSGAQPFLAGTDLALGISLPGLVGGEFDQVSPSDLEARHLIVLANSRVLCRSDLACPPNGTALSNVTVYRMPNGAGVFDAGTFYWSWGLDDEQFDQHVPAHTASSPGFQRFTANILAYLLARK